MVKNTEFITASEIGEYVFCKRGWWLRLNGYLEQSDVMREGTRLHDHIAWSVLLKKKIKMAIIWLICLLVIMLIGLFLLQFLTQLK